ncbi:MAG: DivIVA domain-containing protein [Nitrospirae bacterium]|nr:DivIVA domain-containing protein [Nitrospirota bacterium]
MKITPLDIQQKNFGVKFRGFNVKEVNSFLDLITREFEAIIKENNYLKEELAKKEAKILDFKKKETTLKDTLMNAQQVVENLKGNAQKEAELIIKEAELKADSLIKDAHKEIANLKKELNDLKKQKMLYLEKIKGIIRTFQKMISMEEEDKEDEIREDNVRFLKTKKE